jgi:hypothetical protein
MVCEGSHIDAFDVNGPEKIVPPSKVFKFEDRDLAVEQGLVSWCNISASQ